MRTTYAGRSYLVESDFDHSGLRCVVVLMDTGHRNGYVGVPENHPYYGMNYNDIDNIDVHGGLTFSSRSTEEEYPIETDPPLWWFGFDCNHSYDIPEYGGTYKDTRFVENECRYLAEQLSAMQEGNVKKIRFRAWDTVHKTMCKVETINFIVDTVRLHSETGGQYEVFGEQVILMQYTGMKDIDGTEVYEGDIVKFDDVLHEGEVQIKGFIGKVAFTEFGSFVAVDSRTGKYLYENFRVIGNIYENPELLEVQS